MNNQQTMGNQASHTPLSRDALYLISKDMDIRDLWEAYKADKEGGYIRAFLDSRDFWIDYLRTHGVDPSEEEWQRAAEFHATRGKGYIPPIPLSFYLAIITMFTSNFYAFVSRPAQREKLNQEFGLRIYTPFELYKFGLWEQTRQFHRETQERYIDVLSQTYYTDRFPVSVYWLAGGKYLWIPEKERIELYQKKILLPTVRKFLGTIDFNGVVLSRYFTSDGFDRYVRKQLHTYYIRMTNINFNCVTVDDSNRVTLCRDWNEVFDRKQLLFFNPVMKTYELLEVDDSVTNEQLNNAAAGLQR